MGSELNWDTANNRGAEGGTNADPYLADPEGDSYWISIARSTYQSSTEWHESNLRDQWESNLRAFNNKHPTGSKYFGQEYKHRSKLVRPKTRSMVRRGEAYTAQAFFTTQDLVNIEPSDQDDQIQVASAEVNKELLNLRLEGKPIKWFPTLVGAYQDTRTTGICISKQYWHYEEEIEGYEYQTQYDEMTGLPMLDEDGVEIAEEIPIMRVVKDEPRCRLIAPENFRLDPGADWLNPIESSPYTIELIPMYVVDIKARMGTADGKTGAPPWRTLSDAAIHSARAQEYNSTRQAREDYREDSKDNRNKLREHDIVWVHEYCVRSKGEDWNFLTLGTEHLLTDPVPVEQNYLQGIRPYVMGYSNVETHRSFPASMVELVQDLQREANEIENQRLDNVRFAMNPRIFYRLGASVDLASLSRSVPGGPVGMKNPAGPEADVFVDRPPEVTASAYAEQDRINLDFDELAGTFSNSSVQSNRQLNETVGGMQILSSGANLMHDYDLRIFTETWVEPVLYQLVKLEQAYETDTAILAVAAKKARLWQRYGVDEITDELLAGDFTVRVNVGIGATDPNQRLQRFMMGAGAAGQLLGEQLRMRANDKEIVGEIFGILGYRNADRFFMWPDEDPQVAKYEQIIQQLTQQLQALQQGEQAKLMLEQLRQAGGLEKQKLGDRTKILLELLSQQGEQSVTEAQTAHDMAKTLYQTGAQSQEAARQRSFDAQQGFADRLFQGGESAADRDLTKQQFQANLSRESGNA